MKNLKIYTATLIVAAMTAIATINPINTHAELVTFYPDGTYELQGEPGVRHHRVDPKGEQPAGGYYRDNFGIAITEPIDEYITKGYPLAYDSFKRLTPEQKDIYIAAGARKAGTTTQVMTIWTEAWTPDNPDGPCYDGKPSDELIDQIYSYDADNFFKTNYPDIYAKASISYVDRAKASADASTTTEVSTTEVTTEATTETTTETTTKSTETKKRSLLTKVIDFMIDLLS